jgi:uncharacterized protein (TIGR00255 family)
MLISMTGYGQGEAHNRHARVVVEVRTVNHRYLDLAIKVPKALSHREHELKDLLKNKIQRGRVSITVTADIERTESGVTLNVPLMEQYITQLQGFAKKHKVPGDVDINTLATLPEVFLLKEVAQNDEELWPLVKRSMKQAVDACTKMRMQEGKALEADIRARITAITRLTNKIEKRAPKVVAKHNAALKDRLSKIVNGARVDNDRWMTEVAILADRLDFTEEIIRLKSHLSQIGTCLDKGGAVAKKMTYLLQEVHREATTIASKASDAEVVEYMVSLKEESERLREQVQNLE